MDATTLIDERNIRALVARYCDSLVDRNEEVWGDTWAEECTWMLGARRSEGREGVLHTWRQAMDFFDSVVQIATNGVIEVHGDTATGTWTIQELGWPRKGDAMFTLGFYGDEYVREPDGWRFSARTFRFLYSGPPDLSAALSERP